MMGQGYGQPQPHYHPPGPFGGMQGAMADDDPVYISVTKHTSSL